MVDFFIQFCDIIVNMVFIYGYAIAVMFFLKFIGVFWSRL